jgi:methionyl-tRNA formyltransferase
VVTGHGSLRVVFFGTPAFAVPSLEALLQSKHQVVGVVSQPDRPRGRGQQLQPTPTKAVALAHGVPVLQPPKIRDEAFLEQIRALGPDLAVVVAFGRILPDALIAIPRLGLINVHASLLPKYRGAAPIQRAVLAGDRETGITIMRIVTEMDAGAIFTMRAVPIAPDATSGEMEAILARVGAELLIPVVDDLAAGRAVETPQDHSLATYAPKITKEEGLIDWSLPADLIHNRVRGLQPWPLASTTIHGVRQVLRRSAVTGSDPTPPVHNLRMGSDPIRPGTVLRARGDDLIVACGGGTALRILEIQPEGRRTMTAREFLTGRAVAEGDRLGS